MSILSEKDPRDLACDWCDDSIITRSTKCAMFLEGLGVISNKECVAILEKINVIIERVYYNRKDDK